MKMCIYVEEVRLLILHTLLPEFLDLTPAMILRIIFCNINIVLLLDELTQKIIPYFIVEWM
jgi:hypothetical protein